MARKHGYTGQRIHEIWMGMLNRCNNPNTVGWHNYGGRGIRVCEEWQTFEGFLADIGATYVPGLSIGRVDNDGNYEPGNCQWVTMTEQGNNRRTNRVIVYNGRAMTLEQWSRATGIPRKTISNRLDAGRSVAEALGFAGELAPRKKGTVLAWRNAQKQDQKRTGYCTVCGRGRDPS